MSIIDKGGLVHDVPNYNETLNQNLEKKLSEEANIGQGE